jgi:hypothetical protein
VSSGKLVERKSLKIDQHESDGGLRGFAGGVDGSGEMGRG